MYNYLIFDQFCLELGALSARLVRLWVNPALVCGHGCASDPVGSGDKAILAVAALHQVASGDLTEELPPWLEPWLTRISINFIDISSTQIKLQVKR